MKRFATPVVLAVTAACLTTLIPGSVIAADVPKDRVVVMYFHRTERCPTCKKMGAYSDEAVKSAFKEQIKKGTVAFHFIDFQDKKNEKLAKGYRIEGPALIVAKIANNKVAKFTDLEDIWTKVGDKPAFLKYVQASVVAHQK
jgi:thiol-disulfide isomerase/thioredoxin